MNTALKFSVSLNAILLGVLIFFVADPRKEPAVPAPTIIAKPAPNTQMLVAAPSVAVANALPKPFHWSQLESTNDYSFYVANLRAAGCPAATIRDIVSGDAERAFSFERNQLGLDGSGTGAWSRSQQAKMVAALLGEKTTVVESPSPTQTARNGVQPSEGNNVGDNIASTTDAAQYAGQPSYQRAASAATYPLAFQNMNLDALGFSDSQKAAVQQVQQQFVNDVGGSNADPNSPDYLARWQKAQSDADDMLRGLLGSQAYMAYKQQQYYDWYEPQVTAANSEGSPVIINPGQFSSGN